MSDTSYIYDNVDAYLSLAAQTASPSVYLGTGLQPYLMQAPAYVPVDPESEVVGAETMEALVQSCTTEAERATLAETGMVDFIKDGPVGKYHGYVYNQEGGYLIVLLSLRVDDYLNQGVNADCSDVHLPTSYPPTWRRYGNLQPMWQDAPC